MSCEFPTNGTYILYELGTKKILLAADPSSGNRGSRANKTARILRFDSRPRRFRLSRCTSFSNGWYRKTRLNGFRPSRIDELTQANRLYPFGYRAIKTEVTSEFLKSRVPNLVTRLFSDSFSRMVPPEFLNDWNLVIDCTDTAPAKYAINDLCIHARKPLVTASVYRTSAQFSLFSPNGKPCYRCLYPKLGENDTVNCADAGVLGIQTALAGLQQASLAIRYLIDPTSVSSDSLYLLEWESPIIYESKIKSDPNCPTCGSKGESFSHTDFIRELSPEDYLDRREKHAIILMDVREEEEQNATPIQGAISLPLSRIVSGEKPKLSSETALVLVCESGVRSARAAELLREMFPDIYSLSGGRRNLHSLLAGKNP